MPHLMRSDHTLSAINEHSDRPPLVSIVTPAFNAAPFLGVTIESVLRQSVQDWELTIVDDGSLDETSAIGLAYARHESRIRVIRTPNAGVAAACNCGFGASNPRSPYLVFLDSDDMWEPDALATLLWALEREPRAAGAYGIGRFVNAKGVPFAHGDLEARFRRRRRLTGGRFVPCKPEEPTTLETVVYGATIATTGVCLIRRERLPEPGVTPFKADFRCSGDLHLWMRMARHGHFVFVDRVVINKRCHDHNLTNDDAAVADADLIAINDVIRLDDTTGEQKRLIRRAYLSGRRDEIVTAASSIAALLMKGRLRTAWWWTRQATTPLRSYLRGLKVLDVHSS